MLTYKKCQDSARDFFAMDEKIIGGGASNKPFREVEGVATKYLFIPHFYSLGHAPRPNVTPTALISNNKLQKFGNDSSKRLDLEMVVARSKNANLVLYASYVSY